MLIGEKISMLLSQRGWSAAQLSRAVEVTPAAISRIILGGDTSAKLALAISKSLEVSTEWLIDDARDWPPPKNLEASAQYLPDAVLISTLDERARIMRGLCYEILQLAREIKASKGSHQLSNDERRTLVERMRGVATMAALGSSLASRLDDVGTLAFEASELLDGLFGTSIREVFGEHTDDEWRKYDKWGETKPEVVEELAKNDAEMIAKQQSKRLRKRGRR